MSVNNGPFVYDLREWSLDHSNYRNGISFGNEEATNLLVALKECLKGSDEELSPGQSTEIIRGDDKRGTKSPVVNDGTETTEKDDNLLALLDSEGVAYIDKRSKHI